MGELGSRSFPHPWCSPPHWLWPTAPTASRRSLPWLAGLGLQNLDFASPIDMQVMPALSLG